MFRRTKKSEAAPAELPTIATMPDGVEPFDGPKMRKMVFETLAARVGEKNAAAMYEDFLGHVEDDPKDGVEVAYLCLLGKMVDVIDRINDMLEANSGHSHHEEPISPFLTFRKDG